MGGHLSGSDRILALVPIDLVLDLRGDVRLMIKVKDIVIELWLCKYSPSRRANNQKPFRRRCQKNVLHL